jgi:hypothetical protein
MGLFCDIDGVGGRSVLPRPHKPFTNSDAYAQWDALSAADRLEQISEKLTKEERIIMESLVVQMAGATMAQTGFGDILRWWALSDHDADMFMAYVIRWKLKCGQTEFAKRIFQDALRSGNVDYKFATEVKLVEQSSGAVSVTTREGQSFGASRLVCTIPLNVLHHTEFRPPISNMKVQASKQGQVNSCVKTHAEVAGKEYRSWSSTGSPDKLSGIFADGITPAGNTHLISFSANDSYDKDPAKCLSQMRAEYMEYGSYNIERMVRLSSCAARVFCALELTYLSALSSMA